MITEFQNEYRFLSNFYLSPFQMTFQDQWFVYPTVEHFYQANKAIDYDDHWMIVSQATPGEAKRAGRIVDLRACWEEIKFEVMRTGILCKFPPNTELSNRLLATGDHLLIEGNTWGDTTWGICNGEGRNWLGHLLMARRAELRGC